MYGNKMGWGASVAMAIVIIGLVVFFEQSNVPTQPTALTSDTSKLVALAFPVSPTTLVPMTESGDAATLYSQAVSEYRQNKTAYDTIKSPEGASLPGVKLVVQATNLSGMTFATSRAESLINYQPEDSKEDLLALRDLGHATCLAGLYMKLSNPEEAKKLYLATLSLGVKMFNERLTKQQLDIGFRLMSEACDSLQRLAVGAKDTQLESAVAEFKEGYEKLQTDTINPMMRVITSIDDKVVKKNAGDVFMLATKSQERLFRVEAALSLGRMRFKAGRAGDNRGANSMLKRLAEDKDEFVALAAKRALELTAVDVRQLR